MIAPDKQWQQVVARCWSDPKFRQSLLDDPMKILAAQGIEVPAGVSVVVVEDQPDRLHLVIPAKPGAGADLEKAAAAAVSYINPAC